MLNRLPLTPLTASELPPNLPTELNARWHAAVTDTDRMKILLDAVYQVEYQSRARAVELAEWALVHALRTGNVADIVTVQNLLAFQLVENNRAVEAFRLTLEALTLAHTLPDDRVPFLRALSTRAFVRTVLGDETGAMRDYLAILATESKGTDAVTLLVARMNLVNLYLGMQRSRQAYHHLSIGLELLERMEGMTTDGQPTFGEQRMAYFRKSMHGSQGLVVLALAEEAARLGRMDDLPSLLAELHSHADALGALAGEHDYYLQMSSQALRASAYRLQGRDTEALEAANQAARLNEQQGQQIYTIGFEERAKALQASHQAAALREWQRVLSVVRQSGRFRKTLEVLEELARLSETAGDLEGTLHYTREALTCAKAMNERLGEVYELEALMGELPEDAGEANWRERLLMAERQAQLDPLTSLLNRRGLEAQLHALKGSHAGVTGRELVWLVALLDLDHFKQVNDRFSHAVGDEVLRRVSGLLSAAVSAEATLGRYGGEEFVLVSPVEDADQAHDVLEHLRRVVANHDWSHLLPGQPLTMSVGFTLWRSGEPFEGALQQADEAVYQAKHAGRNVVKSGEYVRSG